MLLGLWAGPSAGHRVAFCCVCYCYLLYCTWLRVRPKALREPTRPMGCQCQSPHRNLFMCVVPRCVRVVCVSQALPALAATSVQFQLGGTVWAPQWARHSCIACTPLLMVAGLGVVYRLAGWPCTPWLASLCGLGCWCGRMPARQQVATVFCGHLASAPVALLSWIFYRLGQHVVCRPEAGLNLSMSAAAAGTLWCPSQWQSLRLGCCYHQYCYCYFTVSGPRLITFACAKKRLTGHIVVSSACVSAPAVGAVSTNSILVAPGL